MPRPLRAVALASLLATTTVGLASCGGDEDRVALAITATSWADDGALEVRTECADIEGIPWVTTVGDEPPTITIWGSPRVGTCEPVLRIELAPGVAKVVDAATSEVVDLPPRP